MFNFTNEEQLTILLERIRALSLYGKDLAENDADTKYTQSVFELIYDFSHVVVGKNDER